MGDLFDEMPEDVYDDEGNIVMKVCSCCGRLLPISEFYKNGRTVSGKPRYRRDCKQCYKMGNNDRVREYREKKWMERYGMPKLEVREVEE